MKSIILIGGAAGTGKSFVAREVSRKFGLPWLSTDQIRTILNIAERDEFKQAQLVWEGVERLLRRPFPWEDGGIIEGVAILPECIAKQYEEFSVKPVFLVYESDEAIRKVVQKRSRLPWIQTKTPDEQNQKVREISAMNARIQTEAEKRGYPCVKAHSEDMVEEVLKLVNSFR